MTEPATAPFDLEPPSAQVIAISGSRTISDLGFVHDALDILYAEALLSDTDLTFRIGDCPSGVDPLARAWCAARSLPYRVFCASADRHAANLSAHIPSVLCADWSRDGDQAGRIRNMTMIGFGRDQARGFAAPRRAADRLVAFHDGSSPGTHNAIACANYLRIPIDYHLYEPVALGISPAAAVLSPSANLRSA